MNKIKCLAFDIDGTLLNDSKSVSETDIKTLQHLGSKNIIRVAATGRNLFSLKRLFKKYFPIDFAVFSSGAGILNWKTQEIIQSKHLNNAEVISIQKALNNCNLDYLIKEDIPNSHYMHYAIKNTDNNDLYHYIQHYKNYCNPLKNQYNKSLSTQIVALLNNNKTLFDTIKMELPAIKTVLTTSPINKQSFWIEFFNKEVSKANGISYLCNKHSIKNEAVLCIGNDYNDLDMLNHFKHSYVVNNAPEELKRMFKTTDSNNQSGVSKVIQMHVEM